MNLLQEVSSIHDCLTPKIELGRIASIFVGSVLSTERGQHEVMSRFRKLQEWRSFPSSSPK